MPLAASETWCGSASSDVDFGYQFIKSLVTSLGSYARIQGDIVPTAQLLLGYVWRVTQDVVPTVQPLLGNMLRVIIDIVPTA